MGQHAHVTCVFAHNANFDLREEPTEPVRDCDRIRRASSNRFLS
jgi:hypothetical protein